MFYYSLKRDLLFKLKIGLLFIVLPIPIAVLLQSVIWAYLLPALLVMAYLVYRLFFATNKLINFWKVKHGHPEDDFIVQGSDYYKSKWYTPIADQIQERSSYNVSQYSGRMKKLNLLSLSVTTGSYKDITGGILELAQRRISSYTCLVNVHMLVEAHLDRNFAGIVNNADVVTADEKPITWGLRLLHHYNKDKIAGADLLPSLLEGAVERQVPVFFLGGTERMLERTRIYAAEKCPDLKIAGTFSPPFRSLTDEEIESIVEMINASGAGLVLVAMGCPKQEKWMASMKGQINACMVGIGGALPVMIGQKRAPIWIQNVGLEWMYRLMQEPRRLFKRYAVVNAIFIWLMTKAYIGKRTFSREALSSKEGYEVY